MILTPVPLAPVDNLEKVPIPELLTLELANDAPTPVNEDPSPIKVFAVTVPDAVILPVTFNSVPLKVKLPLSSTAPEVPATRTRPEVKSDTISDDDVKSVPLNSKLPLSCNAPEPPARTTRPDVKSLTVADDKVVSPPVTDNPPRVYGQCSPE